MCCNIDLTKSFSTQDRLHLIISPVKDFQLCNPIIVVRFEMIINLTSHDKIPLGKHFYSAQLEQ